jgi:hypothetical protein
MLGRISLTGVPGWGYPRCGRGNEAAAIREFDLSVRTTAAPVGRRAPLIASLGAARPAAELTVPDPAAEGGHIA